MRFLLVPLAAAVACAQTLTVSSVMAEPGGKAQVEVSIESRSGEEPLGLQWDLTIPAQALTLEGLPEAAPQARQAGKSVACSGHWIKAPATYAYRCLVTGGERPIANGAVAIFSFRVAPHAKPEKAALRATAATAASAGLKSVRLKTVDGIAIIGSGMR